MPSTGLSSLPQVITTDGKVTFQVERFTPEQVKVYDNFSKEQIRLYKDEVKKTSAYPSYREAYVS